VQPHRYASQPGLTEIMKLRVRVDNLMNRPVQAYVPVEHFAGRSSRLANRRHTSVVKEDTDALPWPATGWEPLTLRSDMARCRDPQVWGICKNIFRSRRENHVAAHGHDPECEDRV
jgi:hypothetical protein